MKAALILIAVVVFLWAIGRKQPEAPESAAPDHQARLLSFTCDPNRGRPRADLAFQNTGQTTIEYAKVLVAFGDASNDGYLDPRPLRPGGTASVTVYSPVKAESGCSFVSLQDADGFSVSVSD
jgi:hypothetical protein